MLWLYADFAKLIESVTGMEDRFSIAVRELVAMREDLQKMQDRSLKASLQKTCMSRLPTVQSCVHGRHEEIG